MNYPAKTTTVIYNHFHGYKKTLTTVGKPAVPTIKKHLRAAKPKDCASATVVEVEGIPHHVAHNGREWELVHS